jgi:hypothetical protein
MSTLDAADNERRARIERVKMADSNRRIGADMVLTRDQRTARDKWRD